MRLQKNEEIQSYTLFFPFKDDYAWNWQINTNKRNFLFLPKVTKKKPLVWFWIES